MQWECRFVPALAAWVADSMADDGADGRTSIVHFYGAQASVLAHEYAGWKNRSARLPDARIPLNRGAAPERRIAPRP